MACRPGLPASLLQTASGIACIVLLCGAICAGPVAAANPAHAFWANRHRGAGANRPTNRRAPPNRPPSAPRLQHRHHRFQHQQVPPPPRPANSPPGQATQAPAGRGGRPHGQIPPVVARVDAGLPPSLKSPAGGSVGKPEQHTYAKDAGRDGIARADDSSAVSSDAGTNVDTAIGVATAHAEQAAEGDIGAAQDGGDDAPRAAADAASGTGDGDSSRDGHGDDATSKTEATVGGDMEEHLSTEAGSTGPSDVSDPAPGVINADSVLGGAGLSSADSLSVVRASGITISSATDVGTLANDASSHDAKPEPVRDEGAGRGAPSTVGNSAGDGAAMTAAKPPVDADSSANGIALPHADATDNPLDTDDANAVLLLGADGKADVGVEPDADAQLDGGPSSGTGAPLDVAVAVPGDTEKTPGTDASLDAAAPSEAGASLNIDAPASLDDDVSLDATGSPNADTAFEAEPSADADAASGVAEQLAAETFLGAAASDVDATSGDAESVIAETFLGADASVDTVAPADDASVLGGASVDADAAFVADEALRGEGSLAEGAMLGTDAVHGVEPRVQDTFTASDAAASETAEHVEIAVDGTVSAQPPAPLPTAGSSEFSSPAPSDRPVGGSAPMATPLAGTAAETPQATEPVAVGGEQQHSGEQPSKRFEADPREQPEPHHAQFHSDQHDESEPVAQGQPCVCGRWRAVIVVLDLVWDACSSGTKTMFALHAGAATACVDVFRELKLRSAPLMDTAALCWRPLCVGLLDIAVAFAVRAALRRCCRRRAKNGAAGVGAAIERATASAVLRVSESTLLIRVKVCAAVTVIFAEYCSNWGSSSGTMSMWLQNLPFRE